MRVYKTFEEIDHDLKIARLRTKIQREEIKLNVAEIKEDLSPASIAGNILGSVAKKAVLFKAIGRFARLLKKKK